MAKKQMLFLLIFSVHFLQAQTDEARRENFNIRKDLAIEGYDPVSYFDRRPLEGDSKWTVRHRGVTYQFSSAENRDKFKSNPEKYEPAFGGWCAYAMGESGEKVKIDPETYKIAEGRLFLFYNFWGNNTLARWNKNEQALKTRADKNWKAFISSK